MDISYGILLLKRTFGFWKTSNVMLLIGYVVGGISQTKLSDQCLEQLGCKAPFTNLVTVHYSSTKIVAQQLMCTDNYMYTYLATYL